MAANVPLSGFLAGLVQGYTKTKTDQAHQELASRAESRDSMLQYLGHMANNQDVPQEHRQWAMQKAAELAQADVTKKLPKVDLGELPQAQIQRSPQQVQAAIPQMKLTPPEPPPQVGQQPSGQVNALGAASGSFAKQLNRPSVLAPPVPPPGPVASAQPSAELPSQSYSVQNPQPPMPIQGSQGQPYLLSPQNKMEIGNELQKAQMQRMQAQFPDKSPAEIVQFMEKGAWPTAENFTLKPGEERYEGGKLAAKNEQAKPGDKSGFEPKFGAGGEPVGVVDVATGGMLTPEEVAANPHASAVFKQASAAHSAQQHEQEAKENRQEARSEARQARSFANATNQKIEADAIKASATARPMVNILDTQKAYVESGKYTPRQDLALIISAVRAMNPGTVRLPNTELEMEIKAGSYGDQFRRWASKATTGVLPDDQRKDLFDVVQKETTRTATSAADNWKQVYGKDKPLPSHLKRFGGEAPSAPQPPQGDFFAQFNGVRK